MKMVSSGRFYLLSHFYALLDYGYAIVLYYEAYSNVGYLLLQ